MAKKTIEKPLPATSAADPQARGANGDASSMLLSIKSVAAALDVSVRTIRNLNSQGDIPKPVKVAGCVRWRAKDLQEWIRDGCPAASR